MSKKNCLYAFLPLIICFLMFLFMFGAGVKGDYYFKECSVYRMLLGEIEVKCDIGFVPEKLTFIGVFTFIFFILAVIVSIATVIMFFAKGESGSWAGTAILAFVIIGIFAILAFISHACVPKSVTYLYVERRENNAHMGFGLIISNLIGILGSIISTCLVLKK